MYKKPIIYKLHDWQGGQRIATWEQKDEYWLIFVGKRGGDLRRYKTEKAMDKEMLKRGFERVTPKGEQSI